MLYPLSGLCDCEKGLDNCITPFGPIYCYAYSTPVFIKLEK